MASAITSSTASIVTGGLGGAPSGSSLGLPSAAPTSLVAIRKALLDGGAESGTIKDFLSRAHTTMDEVDGTIALVREQNKTLSIQLAIAKQQIGAVQADLATDRAAIKENADSIRDLQRKVKQLTITVYVCIIIVIAIATWVIYKQCRGCLL